jgi:hypothetical protein
MLRVLTGKTDDMESPYASAIAALDDEQKARFYLLLAHGLTMAQREVWADDQAEPSEQINRLKWFNEILHRVINRLHDLQHPPLSPSEEDVWSLITHHATQNRYVAASLSWFVRDAYTKTTQQDIPA